jgi:hypothetical protein
MVFTESKLAMKVVAYKANSNVFTRDANPYVMLNAVSLLGNRLMHQATTTLRYGGTNRKQMSHYAFSYIINLNLMPCKNNSILVFAAHYYVHS